MTLYTFDAKSVGVIFGGAPLSGFADGTFVSIEQNEDSFSLQVGTDGDACRSKSNNQSARVTVTLQQSSASNDVLSALFNTDILSPSGDGIFPLMVKDNTGRSILAAEKAWIVKPPTSTFAREAENREWVFETDAMIHNVGGN